MKSLSKTANTNEISKWVLLNANYDTGLQEEVNNYNKLWCVHKSPWVSEHPQTRSSDKPMIYLFSCVDSESSAGQIWLHGAKKRERRPGGWGVWYKEENDKVDLRMQSFTWSNKQEKRCKVEAGGSLPSLFKPAATCWMIWVHRAS